MAYNNAHAGASTDSLIYLVEFRACDLPASGSDRLASAGPAEEAREAVAFEAGFRVEAALAVVVRAAAALDGEVRVDEVLAVPVLAAAGLADAVRDGAEAL